MIDEYGERIEKMEVYVATTVDVSDCKTVGEAYRRTEALAQKLTLAFEESGYSVTDWYEVARNEDGDAVTEHDEE